jgi:ATP-dependent helicase/DNAse subunit B
MRAQRGWTHWDGLTRVTGQTKEALASSRLGARPYSLSALQRYSTCPYQFLLGAIYRLRPAEDIEPLQRLDPLTRGSLFHAIQTAFYRELMEAGELPVTPQSRDRALARLDAAIVSVADDYRERLAPAVDRVWRDEVSAMRRDLRLWVDAVARDTSGWMPRHFEWSFGLSDEGRDPASIADPVTVDGRFPLRGSIDLVEERTSTGELRVTDHKTGKYRGKDHMVVGGGAVLQPVLYGMVLEAAMHKPVVEGRLYYATTEGGYRDVPIALTPAARRSAVEVLEIIDRAVATGFLVPAPAEKACTWCDFRPVCGPNQQRWAVRGKSRESLADLLALRSKP